MKRFIIVIWHQAGGRDDNQTYYTWNNEDTEAAYVFTSKEDAKDQWDKMCMGEIHAGFIIECTPNQQEWI